MIFWTYASKLKIYELWGSFKQIWKKIQQIQNTAIDVSNVLSLFFQHFSEFKDTEYFVGVVDCRTPKLLVLNPEYAHKIFVNDFKSFHDNEIANFVGHLFCNSPFQ